MRNDKQESKRNTHHLLFLLSFLLHLIELLQHPTEIFDPVLSADAFIFLLVCTHEDFPELVIDFSILLLLLFLFFPCPAVEKNYVLRNNDAYLIVFIWVNNDNKHTMKMQFWHTKRQKSCQFTGQQTHIKIKRHHRSSQITPYLFLSIFLNSAGSVELMGHNYEYMRKTLL